MSISRDLLNHHEATQTQRSFFTVPHGPRVAFHEECSHKGQERRNKKPPDVASTREASSCVGAKSNGDTVTRPDGALIDARTRHAVIFVAGVASTREVSRCVGGNGIGDTVNRADDALIDVRARLSVPSWPVWQAHEKPPTVLVHYASMEQCSRNECAVANNSNADSNSAHCFTVCPRTGVLRSSDDILKFRTGTFPATSLGASSLCARCEADRLRSSAGVRKRRN